MKSAIQPAQYTDLRLLVPRLLSADQSGAIKELARRLQSAGRIEDASAFLRAVMERESMLQFPAESGVVFPHARGSGIITLSFAVGLAPHGIAWGDVKGACARVVFLLAIPLSETQSYLDLLARLAALCQNGQLLASLRESVRPEQMLAVLNSVD